MSFVLNNHLPLSEAFQEVAEYLIGSAIADIDDATMDRHDVVHEVRKRCKEMRALLRLARGPLTETGLYDRENHRFRDAARELSTLRDANALLETYDMLAKYYDAEIDRRKFGLIRRRLTLRKKEISENCDIEQLLQTFRAEMVVGCEKVADWAPLLSDSDDLREGFKKPYHRGIRAMATAYESPSSHKFHDWRKRVKYHRYHCELLENIWPEVVRAWTSEVDLLSKLLGQEHDCAVFREILESETERFGETDQFPVALAIAERYQEELRETSHALGLKIFSEKPARVTERFLTWFDLWHEPFTNE